MRLRLASVLMLAVVATSCESKSQARTDEPMAEGAIERVDPAPDGTEFDPPVKVEQLPAQTWYCDMGTVHYARMNEGDGTCPRCGMALQHKE